MEIEKNVLETNEICLASHIQKRNRSIIDALAYIDTFTDCQKQQVEALLHEEVIKHSTKYTKSDISLPEIALFNAILQKKSWQQYDILKLDKGLEQSKFDTSRYNRIKAAENFEDNASWNTIIKNANSQMESLRVQTVNLLLALENVESVWTTNIEIYSSICRSVEHEMQFMEDAVESINKQRKLAQMTKGNELRSLAYEYEASFQMNKDLQLKILKYKQKLQELNDDDYG